MHLWYMNIEIIKAVRVDEYFSIYHEDRERIVKSTNRMVSKPSHLLESTI